MEIDVSKIIAIPSDTEIPVHNNPIQTKRALCANFPENSVILDNTEAIVNIITDISDDLEKNEQQCLANIPQYVEELQAVFNPLDVKECSSDIFKDKEYKLIDNIEDLKKYLSELLIRFDTSPCDYTKQDYLYLLGILYKSLLYLYDKNISLGPNFSEIATLKDEVLELKQPVATKDSVVTHPEETIPSVDYINEHMPAWQDINGGPKTDIKFKQGTYQNYQGLSNKDPNTLYFLDNHQIYKGDELIQSVRTVWPGSSSGSTDEHGFPDTITPDMRNNYFISLENGEIRFVDEDLEYISVTDLELESILVNREFLQRLIAAIADTKEVIMPTLTVDGTRLIWTESNVDSITVFVPKQ